MNKKILFGIPKRTHVILALDEVEGFKNLGYECTTIVYNRNNPNLNILLKLYGVVVTAFKIIKLLYKHKFSTLYLNSRFGPAGCVRDFLTVLILNIFYFTPLKIVIKTHGSDLTFVKRKSFFYDKLIFPYLGKNVDFWFFLSEEEKLIVQDFYPVIGVKSFVTQNIIDAKRSVRSVEFLEKHNLNDNRFKFFFAGRMIAEKGIFSIIRAIPDFKYKDDSIFIFAGDGEEYNEFKSEIKKLQIEKYVHLTGFLSEEECDHFYANTDTLVFPTYFDEGFPMALFKSVASGLPIITTQTRAASDHLKEPDNCLWVNGKDTETVLKAMTKLYENDSLREKMVLNNRYLGKNFTKKEVTEQMNLIFLQDSSKI